ncbi:hypothetical protein PHMEG_00035447, partial [Phytophthora megakarya]
MLFIHKKYSTIPAISEFPLRDIGRGKSGALQLVAAADSQPVDASKTFPERGLWRETHATRTNGINNKRFLQVEGTSNQSIIVTRSMNETSNNKSTAAPSKEEKLKFSVMSAKTTPNFAEERGVKVAGLSKFFKGKKVTTAVTN